MPVRRTWFARTRAGVCEWALAASWLAFGSAPAFAQPVPHPDARESQVKAAYVYKFTEYVEWPADVFAKQDAPLVIGVIGAYDIAAALEVVVEGKAVDQHRVQVRRLDGDAAADAVHVLVIGALDRPTLERTLTSVRGKPVLVVSSERLPQAPGVMIDFVVLEQRVRFEVMLAPVSQSRMRLSSRMLSVAHRVTRSDH